MLIKNFGTALRGYNLYLLESYANKRNRGFYQKWNKVCLAGARGKSAAPRV